MTRLRVAAIAPLIIASATVADTATLPAHRDTSIFQDTLAERSNGIGHHVFCGHTLFAGERRALIRFDLSSIPAGSVINSVELRMNITMLTALSSTFELHALTASWDEGTSDAGDPGGRGALATAGDASWNFRVFPTDAWSTAGGDFVAAPSASTTATGLGPVTWSGAGLVADVSAWLNAPASNFGWIFVSPSSPGSAARFDSRENPLTVLPPQLTVNFTPPASCPADFNNSGGISVQDIFDFLAAYFSSDPAADFNGGGGITVQDIFDYLAAYFTGC